MGRRIVTPTITPVGERAVVVVFSDQVDQLAACGLMRDEGDTARRQQRSLANSGPEGAGIESA